MLDRKVLFAELRVRLFTRGFTQSQVDGINTKLDVWERAFEQRTPLAQAAYCFATSQHETGGAMTPVIETRRPSEAANPSVDTAISRLETAWAAGKMPWVRTAYWRKDVNGLSWLGRSDVQLTHKANYQKATQKLRDLGLIPPGVDFTKTPDAVLDPRISAMILFAGMEGGWFTGHTLDQLIDGNIDGDELADFTAARVIVNSKDRATLIAGYAVQWLATLRAAWVYSGVAPKLPPTATIPTPATPAPVVVADGFWARFKRLFTSSGA